MPLTAAFCLYFDFEHQLFRTCVPAARFCNAVRNLHDKTFPKYWQWLQQVGNALDWNDEYLNQVRSCLTTSMRSTLPRVTTARAASDS